jgi:hypothetical protein
MPQDSEPQWLKDARKRGLEIRDTAVNVAALSGNVASPSPELTDGESEAEFQQRVIALAQQLGWRVAHFRKVRVQRGDSTYWETPVGADGKGFPDLLMLRNSMIVFAELKVRPRKTTPEQDAWLNAISLTPSNSFVWYPDQWKEIVETLT